MLFFMLSILSSTSLFAQDTLRLKKYFGNLKAVEVGIQGKQYDFLFDTGGGETFISPVVARQLNKKLYGRVTSFRMSGESIQYQKADSVSLLVGSSNIFHETIGVWDVMTLLPKGFPPVHGVLSLKTFKDSRLTLSLADNYIILETPSTLKKRVRPMHLIESRFASGMDGHDLTIFLCVPKQQHRYWLLFDSGNLNDLLLSHSTAFEWKLQSDTVQHRNQLSEVELLIGSSIIRGKATSTSMIYDGALNFDLLKQFIFTIDFPLEKIWVSHLAVRNIR